MQAGAKGKGRRDPACEVDSGVAGLEAKGGAGRGEGRGVVLQTCLCNTVSLGVSEGQGRHTTPALKPANLRVNMCFCVPRRGQAL